MVLYELLISCETDGVQALSIGKDYEYECFLDV